MGKNLFDASDIGGDVLLVDGRRLFNLMIKKYPEECKALQRKDAGCFTDGIDKYTGPVLFQSPNGEVYLRFRDDNCVTFHPEIVEAVNKLCECINNNIVKINMREGQGYLICNYRWLHGRSAFEDNRIIRRIHAYSPNL